MTSASPSGGQELIVVGGLTVDRFPDGSAAAGGAVLHITRALAARGARVGIVTTVGPEPEAAAGLAELRDLAASVEASGSTASITFGHVETPAGRELKLESLGGQVPPITHAEAAAILFAPVADEVPVAALGATAGPLRGAILQGWLRSTAPGESVTGRRLSSLDAALLDALGGLDLVIGSSEDLRADGARPLAQLRAMRGRIGDRPPLVVTDGARGLWVDDGSGAQHLSPARPITGVSTIGAGDMFAAFMLLELAGSGGADPSAAAQAAMQQVGEVLESRRGD